MCICEITEQKACKAEMTFNFYLWSSLQMIFSAFLFLEKIFIIIFSSFCCMKEPRKAGVFSQYKVILFSGSFYSPA